MRRSVLAVLLLAACGGAPAEPLEAEPGATAAEPGGTAAEPVATGVEPADASSLEARRKALHEDVKRLVHDLGEAGRYDCCIEQPCQMCAMRAGGCKCGEGARRGEPVCEECALMWTQGHGAEPGVDPKSVRSYLEAAREHTEGKRCACPDEQEPASPP